MPLPDYVSELGHSLAQAQRDYLRFDRDGTHKKYLESANFRHME